MRIAPKLQIDKRDRLEPRPEGQPVSHWHSSDWTDALNQNDWPLVARILRDRVYGRFLRVIPKIKSMEGAGFAIMALDCLLIETLCQFQHGWLRTPNGRGQEVFGGFLLHQMNGFEEKTVKRFYKPLLLDFR